MDSTGRLLLRSMVNLWGMRCSSQCIPPGRAGKVVVFELVGRMHHCRSIHLEDLYVLEESRSKGIGLAMLQYVAKFAAVKGCARVEWEALDWNVKAHGFYDRIGAVKMPEWIKFRLNRDGISKVAASF